MNDVVSVTRLPISKELIQTLQTHNILSVNDMFQYSPFELSIILDVNMVVAVDLVDCATLALSPTFVPSWEMYESIADMETVIPLLRVPHGTSSNISVDPAFSLQIGSINEIVGAEVDTRADVCLSATAHVVLDREYGGMEGGVVYITSASQSVDIHRLNEILRARVRLAYFHSETPDSAEIAKQKVLSALSRVHIKSCATAEETAEYLESLQEFYLDHDVRLIVIEDVDMFSKTLSSLQRHYIMARLVALLKRLCVTYELCVCCTSEGVAATAAYSTHARTGKQSATNVGVPGVFSDKSLSVSYRALMSATLVDKLIDAKLGVAWNHGVTYRYTLFGMYDQHGRWTADLYLVKSADQRLGRVCVSRESEGLVVDVESMREYTRSKYTRPDNDTVVTAMGHTSLSSE